MIKNLLYSLFLHFLLLLLVYANFNLKNIDENKSSEISVSLISLSGSEDFDQSKVSSRSTRAQDKKKSKKESSKEAKSKRQSSKNKVATLPENIAKSKPEESITKPLPEDSGPQVKEITNPAEKREESDKVKKDEVKNNNFDDKKTKESKKEQDIGSEKTSEEEQESDDNKNISESASSSKVSNLENIDLSVREKFNIQSQLRRCYSRAVLETGYNNKSKIMIEVSINEEGVIDSDIDDTIDMEKYNDPKDTNYKIAIDNARRALDLCSPLRNLPTDKYEIWKKIALDFGDPN